jgi:DNA-binding NarL/FixJ family response regulator
MADLRVLVVSSNALARAGMEALVVAMPDIKVVGSGGLSEAASLASQLLPDAVLIDVGEGEPEELDAIAGLAAAQPGLPLVALGGQVAALAQALSFGASALLPAGVDPSSLRLALLAAQQGMVTISRRDLPALLPEEEAPDPDHKPPAESLTPRELAVLQLMARGLTNRQIGLQLKISEHTVKFHAASVLGKLAARSRAEAVARAISLGWILV